MRFKYIKEPRGTKSLYILHMQGVDEDFDDCIGTLIIPNSQTEVVEYGLEQFAKGIASKFAEGSPIKISG